MPKKPIAVCFLIVAFALYALSIFFYYKHGCLFDGKHWEGDILAAREMGTYSLYSLGIASVSLVIGVWLLKSTFQETLRVLKLVGVLSIPAWLPMSCMAEMKGSHDCQPTSNPALKQDSSRRAQ